MIIIQKLITPIAGKDIEHQELPFTAGGNEKWHCHLGDSLAISHTTKHTLIMTYSNHTSVYLHKGVKNFVCVC